MAAAAAVWPAVWLGGVVAALLLLLFVHWNRLVAAVLSARLGKPLPPGTQGLPFFGETVSWILSRKRKGAWAFARERLLRYGPVYKTHLFGSPTVAIVGGEGNRFILQNENKLFVAALPKAGRVLMGPGSLFEMRGETHRRNKRLLLAAFTHEALASYAPAINAAADRCLREWRPGVTVRAYEEIMKFTFDVAAEVILGASDDVVVRRLRALYPTWVKGLFSLPIRVPFVQTAFSRALEAREGLLREFTQIMKQKRSSGEDLASKPDVLSRLMTARDEDGAGLEDDVIKDLLINVLVAGYDTSCNTLACALRYMSEYPEVYEKVRAEQLGVKVHKQLQLKEESYNLTLEDCKTLMPYTDAMLAETLRIRPPVPAMGRLAICNTEYKGYAIPKGWVVQYSAVMTHHDEKVYQDPEKFNSHRLEDSPPPPFSYIPFGGGARLCIGESFAKLEMKLFLQRLVTTVAWTPLGPLSNLDSLPVQKPVDGFPVIIKGLE